MRRKNTHTHKHTHTQALCHPRVALKPHQQRCCGFSLPLFCSALFSVVLPLGSRCLSAWIDFLRAISGTDCFFDLWCMHFNFGILLLCLDTYCNCLTWCYSRALRPCASCWHCTYTLFDCALQWQVELSTQLATSTFFYSLLANSVGWLLPHCGIQFKTSWQYSQRFWDSTITNICNAIQTSFQALVTWLHSLADTVGWLLPIHWNFLSVQHLQPFWICTDHLNSLWSLHCSLAFCWRQLTFAVFYSSLFLAFSVGWLLPSLFWIIGQLHYWCFGYFQQLYNSIYLTFATAAEIPFFGPTNILCAQLAGWYLSATLVFELGGRSGPKSGHVRYTSSCRCIRSIAAFICLMQFSVGREGEGYVPSPLWNMEADMTSSDFIQLLSAKPDGNTLRTGFGLDPVSHTPRKNSVLKRSMRRAFNRTCQFWCCLVPG